MKLILTGIILMNIAYAKTCFIVGVDYPSPVISDNYVIYKYAKFYRLGRALKIDPSLIVKELSYVGSSLNRWDVSKENVYNETDCVEVNNKIFAKGSSVSYRYPKSRNLQNFRLIKVFENGYGVSISRNYKDAYEEFEENPRMIDYESKFGIVVVNLNNQ